MTPKALLELAILLDMFVVLIRLLCHLWLPLAKVAECIVSRKSGSRGRIVGLERS